MIHSASAGRSPNHMDLMCFYKAAVDFLFAILILPDDDGIVILPKDQIVSLHAVR